MRVVVADTGPHNYLVLIDAIDLLPKLFDQVLAPQTVRDALSARRTPERVRSWIVHDELTPDEVKRLINYLNRHCAPEKPNRISGLALVRNS